MTRINCVPASELVDKHLIAEYRELPRIFKLAQNWFNRGQPTKIPDQYKLGSGHVTFFYNKLQWLYERQCQLIAEMQVRGFKPNFTNPQDLIENCSKSLLGNWEPKQADLEINRARIHERLS